MCAVESSFKSEHQLTSQDTKNDKRMPEPDIKMLDGMLTIAQVSKLTDVNKTTLRYWERKFNNFLIPKRIERSQRQYSLKDIEIIKIIKKLRNEEYLSIKGISLRLKTLYPQYGDEA
jgi:hypothetical protein